VSKNGLVILLIVSAMLWLTPPAKGNSLLRIDVSGTALTCDNSNAGGVAACMGSGFSTALGGNAITFTGTVNGVSFGGGGIVGVQLFGNAPGNAVLAFVLDSATAVSNLSGALRVVTLDFAGNNFALPVGTGFLSASQTANWTMTTSGDSQAFTAWQRNDNALVIPGAGIGGTTAVSPNCVSPGGLAQSCASETLNVPASPTAPYALTGRQVITMSPGSIASYTGTSVLTAESIPVQAPEPGSVFLVGAGLLLLAGRQGLARKN
jgi:hypothetical protein